MEPSVAGSVVRLNSRSPSFAARSRRARTHAQVNIEIDRFVPVGRTCHALQMAFLVLFPRVLSSFGLQPLLVNVMRALILVTVLVNPVRDAQGVFLRAEVASFAAGLVFDQAWLAREANRRLARVGGARRAGGGAAAA